MTIPHTTVTPHGGMVASSSTMVSDVGAAVLASGGTAGDAVLAMAAMSFVVLPGQCGIGGDAFVIWYEGQGNLYRAVQGSGVGPDGADIDFYFMQGLPAVPLSGPLSISVPGAPAAMRTLHEHLGTRPLEELWAPAIAAARGGIPLSAKTRGDIEVSIQKLIADPISASVFLPDGMIPEVGTTLRQTDLAATLEHLAKGLHVFYEGDVGERCLDALRDGGAPFSGHEWKGTVAPATETLRGAYGRYVVHENPLPSPGYMVIQQLAMLDGLLAGLPWLSGPAVHLLAEAAILSFAQRRELVGSDSNAWLELLGAKAMEASRRRLTSGQRCTSDPGSVREGDTTSFVAADAMGNVVSYIHSLAYTFGSGLMVPDTGIMLNDRLSRGPYLIPRHPNALHPGRKPMHTLNAWIVSDQSGRPILIGNTPGGDGQVQWNVQVLSHLLDYGVDPQQAVDAPRFTVFPGSDADVANALDEVRCESRLEREAVDALRRAGHRVVLQGPWDGGGSAQVIAVDPSTGQLNGASDSRFDGGIRSV